MERSAAASRGGRAGARRLALAALLAAATLAGCGESQAPRARGDLPRLADPDLALLTGDFDAMRERQLIRALVTPNRTDFFLDHGELKGIQAEFLAELGDFLNAGVSRESERIRIKFVPVAFGELIPALRAGRGDIAAAFLTETPQRREQVRFVSGLRERVDEVVVTHVDVEAPETVADLAGREIYVLRGSSYVEHLARLDARLREQGLAPLRIREADARLESDDILELVNAGVIEVTVVDDYKARLWARVLPDIAVHEDVVIAADNPVSWAVRRDAPELHARLDAFAAQIREGSLLGNVLFERYFEDLRWLNDPNTRAERDKLQRYIGLFRKYGDEYGFEPLALAAQAYQESRLDQTRRSHRGAVGIMQVLPSTARSPVVDIPDIEEVENNIHAGVKYLAFLRDRYFSSPQITDWDSRALAWAAYNAGPRRIRRARRAAARLGLDPDVWFDNVEIAVGRNVGREPVRYVANVHKYYVAYRLARGRLDERSRAVEAVD